MIMYDFEQYSDEWWNIRSGCLTASRFKNICTATGKKSDSLNGEAFRLACETITGKMDRDSYTNHHMQRGLDLEPIAKNYYGFITGSDIKNVGFIKKNDSGLLGCSPDGLIDGEFGLEIKCPSDGIHLKYIIDGVLPTEYVPQVYGSLYVADELESWVFISYHPDMEPFILRVERDDNYNKYIEKFKEYVDLLEEKKYDIISKYNSFKEANRQ